jgi:mRNA interferase MazF
MCVIPLANLNYDCDIVTDQPRAIDNRRIVKKIGDIPTNRIRKIKENMRICLDLI